jgi:hypothetical protein
MMNNKNVRKLELLPGRSDSGKSLLGPPSLDEGCREEEHRISVQLAFT